MERPQSLYDGHRNSGFKIGNVTMTTKRTAATWRANLPVPFAVAGILAALALGGCESGASLLGGANQPPVAVADTPVAAKTLTVAIAPVLGVPEPTSKDIMEKLAGGLDKTRFTVAASPTTPSDYTLRGYATAAKDKTTGKLSYFFDVIDKSGQKINRIAGEEPLANPAAGKDMWQSVTPAITQTVATKTATSFAASIPGVAPLSGGAGPAMASIGPSTPMAPTPVKATAAPADIAAAAPIKAASSIGGPVNAVTAVVPYVTGAPGDGSQTLAAALQKELSRNGVAMGDSSTAQAYKVEGKVAVGAENAGKQPIQIDWVVKDPQGKKLGTVSQKNEIPQGSLDGAWGKTADAAAAAAAQGILKLIPGTKTQ